MFALRAPTEKPVGLLVPDDVSAMDIGIGEPTGKVCRCIDPWSGPGGILVPSDFLILRVRTSPALELKSSARELQRSNGVVCFCTQKMCVRLLVPASVLGGEVCVGQALDKLRLCSRRTPLAISVCRGHRRRTRLGTAPHVMPASR